MRVLVKISHPAHVHFFKNFIWEMEERGHEIFVLATPREMALKLLDLYGIDYETYKSKRKFDFLKIRGQLRLNYETWKRVVKFELDFLTGIGGTSISHVSRFTKAPSVVFTDTEHAGIQNNFTFPFSDYICTPDCYLDDLGPKQIRYPGYHELAYLHPNRFSPDSSVLDYIDADKDDKIVILRLIAWQAIHDVGHSGFGDVVDVVHRLESTGAEVVITAEGDIPEEVEHCQSKIPPHRMHDLMYYSNLYIGESGTMATESAILGTPAILVSTQRPGTWEELDNKYGLINHFFDKNSHRRIIKRATSILKNYDSKKWKRRQKRLLKEKIDVTKFMIDLFENINEG
ncbi:MAG: DUF354 domain-containing protein [Thermoplasmatota archaeon]